MSNGQATVQLVGNLTRDPESRTTTSGLTVLRFGVAVGQRRGAGQDATDETHFFDVVMFGKVGEAFARFHHKGSRCALTGRLQQETWEKDGRKQSRVSVIAESWVFCGDSRGGGGHGAQEQQRAPAGTTSVDAGEDTPF